MSGGRDPGDSGDPNDDYDDDAAADSRVPYTGYLPTGGGWGWGWLPVSRGDADPAYADEEAEYTEETPAETGGSWWGEGLITLVLVAGVILFLFPEPATSALGMLLIVVGVIAWLIDLFA